MPRISIITPCYNAAIFISVCIENVIEQSCDCEHIIIDGGSTDGTQEIIAKYASKYPHIRWVSEKDSGQSDAMNKGIRMAKGEILSFLNADDYYQPGTLNRVLEIFKNVRSPAFVVGNCRIFNHSGKLIRTNKPAQLSVSRILSGEMEHPVNPAAYFYHKRLHDLCGDYQVDEHHMMDVDMLLRMLRIAHIHYFDEDWGNWRVHRGTKSFKMSVSGNSTSAFAGMMQKHIDLLPEPEKTAVHSARMRLGLLLSFLWLRLAEAGFFLGEIPFSAVAA